MRGEPEVHKKGLFASGCLRPSVPPDFTLDLGFIGSSHRDGKPRFRSTAPPPDGAERVGSQRRVPDGARRPRLRAAPRSLPAGEILLIPPLHGSALRSVVNAAASRVYERRMCLEEKKKKVSSCLLSEAYVLHIPNLGRSVGRINVYWERKLFNFWGRLKKRTKKKKKKKKERKKRRMTR